MLANSVARARADMLKAAEEQQEAAEARLQQLLREQREAFESKVVVQERVEVDQCAKISRLESEISDLRSKLAKLTLRSEAPVTRDASNTLSPPRPAHQCAEAAPPSPRAALVPLHVVRLTLLCGQMLPKPGEERAAPEPWLQGHSPLAKPMRPSDAPIVSPVVCVDLVGGSFASASARAPGAHGEKWESSCVSRNGF